jgi:hypothetical protein
MPSRSATDTQITHGSRLWLYLLVALTLFFLVIPSLVIVPLSFSDSRYLVFPPPGWSMRWYEAYLSSSEWRQATTVSFVAAILTMILATTLGTLAAYSLHTSMGRRVQALYVLFMVPMIVPAILIAVGTFILYAQLGLNNTLQGIVLAHTAMALPLVVITVMAGFKSYDMNQEMVARSLGAAADSRLGDFGGAPRLHHLARRGGDLALHRRRRLRDADQAHVQCAARRDRPDHRRHLDDPHRLLDRPPRPQPVDTAQRKARQALGLAGFS